MPQFLLKPPGFSLSAASILLFVPQAYVPSPLLINWRCCFHSSCNARYIYIYIYICIYIIYICIYLQCQSAKRSGISEPQSLPIFETSYGQWHFLTNRYWQPSPPPKRTELGSVALFVKSILVSQSHTIWPTSGASSERLELWCSALFPNRYWEANPQPKWPS